MHAMLALSASHLLTTSTSQLRSESLSYRGLALKGLNNALSKPPECKEDADAMLATCWALSFQTTYMGESVEEFLTMMRGCTLIMNQNWKGKFGTSFHNLSYEARDELIVPLLESCPLVNQEFVTEGRESMQRMKGLKMDAVEEKVFQLLTELVRLLSVSSLEGWFLKPSYIRQSELISCKHISNTRRFISSSAPSRMLPSRILSTLQTP
jgi:hypothetical protein